MTEFMAVSGGDRRTCCNVHAADVRQSACNGLCEKKAKYGNGLKILLILHTMRNVLYTNIIIMRRVV